MFKVIPAFAAVTRSSPSRLQEFHLQQLAILVGIIGQHVRNHTPDLLGIVTELWQNTALQSSIVNLIQAIGNALDAEFKPFLPAVLPLLLRVFEGELNEKRMNTQIRIFDAFQAFGANIEEYLHLVIPPIIRSAETPQGSLALRKRAVQVPQFCHLPFSLVKNVISDNREIVQSRQFLRSCVSHCASPCPSFGTCRVHQQ